MGWLAPVPAAEVEARLTAKGRATPLRRCLTLADLVFLGIGKMVGAGIFVLLGAAASTAGNATFLAYAVAGLVALLSALVYGELTSRMPACGSAYAYTLLGLGRLPAIVTAQLVLLEYTVGAAALGAAWTAYFASFLAGCGVPLPEAANSLGGLHPLAAGIVLAVGAVALSGIREAALFATVVTALKVGLIVVVVGVAVAHAEPEHWRARPFAPSGLQGVLEAASTVFYSFIGFEAVTTTAEEAIAPERTVPRAILICVALATLIYASVSVSITLMVPFTSLEVGAPVASAFEARGLHAMALLVSGVCTVGLLAGLLLNLLAGARLWLTLAGEQYVPRGLGVVDPSSRVPARATLLGVTLSSVLALLLPLEALVSLMATGTIGAFVLVSIALGAIKGRGAATHVGFALACLATAATAGWVRAGTAVAAAVAAGAALWPRGEEAQPLRAAPVFAVPAVVPLLAIAANAALLAHVDRTVLAIVAAWVLCGLARAAHLALTERDVKL